MSENENANGPDVAKRERIRFKADVLRNEAQRLSQAAEENDISTLAEVADRMNAAASAMDEKGPQFPSP
jgi:hypothetical protein